MNDQQQNAQNPQEQQSSNTKRNTDTSAVYSGDSSLQNNTEFEEDKKSKYEKEEDNVKSSGVDDLISNSDGAAGTDRAGTAERKKYGDPELNKGLESQAKDEES